MNKRFLLVGFVVGFLTITRPTLARDPTIGAKLRLLVGFVVGHWSGSKALTRPERWHRTRVFMLFSVLVVGLVGFFRM